MNDTEEIDTDRKERFFVNVDTKPSIEKLVEIYGVPDAAALIGLSPSGLKAILSGTNPCRLSYEQSAAYVLHTLGDESTREVFVLVKTPKSEAEFVETMLKGMKDRGVTFRNLDT